jgi:Xaa-Pro aminopeptidase
MTLSNVSADRINCLQAQMSQSRVDVVAIAPTANMRYLLGFAPLADERLCALLVTPRATRFVVPAVNADQVETHTGLPAMRWGDAAGPAAALAQALIELDLKPNGVLAADDTMRADALLTLQETIRPAKTVAAGTLMTPLRAAKSATEIEALARAAALTDQALLAGAAACQLGTTEREIAAAIANAYQANGAESVDFTIVASGPNSAFPHHETGGRRLQPGDTVILDIGATLAGYKSDITRVVHLGEPPDEVKAAYQAVQEANRRGREAAVAGVPAREVDRAARQAIEQAGYGPLFTHRTGHGLGLEAHEPPWITAESETILEPGMVFSVEPGVYLPGKFGIRIEDIVVVTEGACRCLTGLDHDLIINA